MKNITQNLRLKTKNNIYKLIKKKSIAKTVENNLYKHSKGDLNLYYDQYQKIMVLIIPKKI